MYIESYNTKRPHQSIGQRIPNGYVIQDYGKIKLKPKLFGLNYEYYWGQFDRWNYSTLRILSSQINYITKNICRIE